MADALAGGEVAGVVLVGRAGVGKTRLATESLAIAERIGFATDRVLATRAAATVPFGALAPLLGSPTSDNTLGPGALRAATRAVAGRGGDQPFMLLVDDAHLLDSASATVVHQLATTTDTFVVVTVRTGEPCPDPVEALWKDEVAARLDLEPLDREDTERLVGELLDGIVEAATARTIWDRSEGNPLFVRELVTAAMETDLLQSVDGIWRLVAQLRPSPRLDELVGARLVGLSAEELAAFELVVVGEPLGLPLLLAMTDAATVDGLERRGLIAAERSEKRVEVRPAHPLLGDVLRDRLPPLRAMALARRLYETVTDTGARRREDPMRVAVWALDSGGAVDPDSMLVAARRAKAAHDLDLAARLAQASVDQGGATVDAVQVLAEVLAARGRHDDAHRVLADAADRATDDRQRALVALTRADLLFWGLDRDAEAAAVIERAMTTISEEAWLDELVGQRATFELLAGRPREALALVTPILARAGGRPFAEAATTAAPALAVMGRSDDAIAIADSGFVEHLGLGDQAMLSHAGIHLVSHCFAQMEAGRLEDAEREARLGYEGAVEGSVPEGQAWFALLLGRALWLRRPAEAETWFRRGDLAFHDVQQDGPRRWCLAGAACCAAIRGDLDRARSLAAAEAELGGAAVRMMAPDVLRSRAWVAWASGDPVAARRLLEEAAEEAAATGAASLESAALHDRVRLGEPAGVDERLSELAGVVDGELSTTRADHAVALLVHDPDALTTVSDQFVALGATVLAGEAAGHAAAAHRQDGNPRAAERLAQRQRALAQEAGGIITPAMALGGDAAALTRREREIARLAATGRTNRDIADALVVSLRTVENHLHRVYEKLGVAGREELAAALDPGS